MVRLQGGDPCIFGGGNENVSVLWQRASKSQLQGKQRVALDFQLQSPAILLIGAVATQAASAVHGQAPELHSRSDLGA
jgi:siroheme synthase